MNATLILVVLFVAFFFIMSTYTQSPPAYQVPMPAPAPIPATYTVNNTHLLANQSRYNSKQAQQGESLYTSDVRGPPSKTSGYVQFVSPEGTAGPMYPGASFRGIASSDERGPAPMPNPPAEGVTTAPPNLPIRFKDTNYDVSWTLNRKPQ